MRTLQELIDRHSIIWFSIGSDKDLCTQFMSELAELGMLWVNGRPVTPEDNCSYFMGFGPSRTIGHISWQIWRVSWLNEESDLDHRERFYSNGQIPLRVDYGKYRRGEEDYLVRENVVKIVGGFTYPVGGRVLFVD